MPEVSVIIVARNREHLIGDAIRSALDQTFPDIEVIVVDDGSTDGTFDVARSFDGVRAYRIEPTGIAWARNFAAQRASGNWLAILDSDDRWLPNKIEVQLKALKESELAFSATDAFLVDESGRRVGRLSERQRPYDGHVFSHLVRSNFICTPTVMIDRQLFWQAGGFDPRMVSAEDYHLWLRTARTYPLLYIPEPLTEYRDHPQGRMQRRQVEVTDWTIRAFEDVLASLEIDAEHIEFRKRLGELNYYAAVWHLAKGQIAWARRHLLTVLKRSPYKTQRLRSLVLWLRSFLSDNVSKSARRYIIGHVDLWPWSKRDLGID